MGNLFQELKRRKVFKVAAVYAVVAWLLIQVASTILPTFEAPDWVNQTITLLFILGFPVAVVLAWAYEVTPEGVKPESQTISLSRGAATSAQPINYVILAVVLMMAGIQVTGLIGPGPTPPPPRDNNDVLQVSIRIPTDQIFHPVLNGLDISHDGSFFIYLGSDPDPESSDSMIWVRPFDSLEARPLFATRGAGGRAKISPDGNEVLFRREEGVSIAPINGGIAREVALFGDAPSWGSDGEFVYFQNEEEGISRVHSSGSEVEVVTRGDTDGEFSFHVFVDELSPGDKIVYQARNADNVPFILGHDLISGARKPIVQGKFPIYTESGHLLFQAPFEPVLFAAEFDINTMEITAEPVPIAENLHQTGGEIAANITVSDSGRLLYRVGSTEGIQVIPTWIDRQGMAQDIDPELRFSAFGNFHPGIAVSQGGDKLAIGVQTSRELANIAGLFGRASAWKKSPENPGLESELLTAPDGMGQVLASHDGRWLVYRSVSDLYLVDAIDPSSPRPLIVDDFDTVHPSLSPDDRWLAYVSSETGTREVFVRPFPNVEDGQWLVSVGGGTNPVWSDSGGELFYLNSSNEVVAVQVDNGATFTRGREQTLFSMEGFHLGPGTQVFDVMPDGQQFVALRRIAADVELIMVDNWTELLRLSD
jgi:hypothetical protein